jgi:hypothetical protein
VRFVRPISGIAAAVIGLAALSLAVGVVDLWRDIRQADFRFQTASTRQTALWEGLDPMPASLSARLLGLEDDLAYRRTVELFQRVRPGTGGGFGPRTESLRGQAQLELTRASEADSNPVRRSKLLNFLGIMPLDRPSTVGDERADQLRTAIGILQNAVRVDAGNSEAKLNLELLLRDAARSGLPPTSNIPTGDRVGGPLSGFGGVGSSGY